MEIILKNIVNVNRFINLCKIEFFNNWKTYLLKDLLIALILVNFGFLTSFFRAGSNPYFYFYINLFIGIILTSNSFIAVHNQERGVAYFMFPASIEEKFIVKFLFTSVFYFISAASGIFIASAVSETIRALVFKGGFSMFNPLTFEFLKALGIFMFFHSIFFFGSIFFKKNNFLMTVLALIIISIVITIVFTIIAVNFFRDFLGKTYNINVFGQMNDFLNSGIFALALKIAVFFILPVVLYILTLLKLRTSEVR